MDVSPLDGSTGLPARRQPPLTDIDRQRFADVLQQACGDGRLTLAEFTERVGAVWAADTTDELELATGDIARPLVGTASGARIEVALFGDISRVGRWRLPRRLHVLRVFGGCTLDLRGSVLADDAVADGIVDITDVSVFGNLAVVVPEGVEVELIGFSLFGTRRLRLAPVPAAPGAPTIRVRAFALFGVVNVHSRP